MPCKNYRNLFTNTICSASDKDNLVLHSAGELGQLLVRQ
jgi:hypothetical protein